MQKNKAFLIMSILICMLVIQSSNAVISPDAVKIVNKDYDFSYGRFSSSNGWIDSAYATEGNIDSSDKAEYGSNLITLTAKDDNGFGEDRGEVIKISQTMNEYDFTGENKLTVEVSWESTIGSGSGIFSETTDVSLVLKLGTEKQTIDSYLQTSSSHSSQSNSGTDTYTFIMSQSSTDLRLEVYINAVSIAYEVSYIVTIYYVKVTGDVTDPVTATSDAQDTTQSTDQNQQATSEQTSANQVVTVTEQSTNSPSLLSVAVVLIIISPIVMKRRIYRSL